MGSSDWSCCDMVMSLCQHCVCVFRVTPDLLEVLVYLVWMDVTEPEETKETLDFLENKEPMDYRSEPQ